MTIDEQDGTINARGWTYEKNGYNRTTETISVLLNQAAELFIDEYGHDNYVAGRTGTLVPFLRAAELAYFPAHKRRFPNRWDGHRDPPGSPRAKVQSLLRNYGELTPVDGDPVVYGHYNTDGSPIYVGKTFHFFDRQKAHRGSSHWWEEIEEIVWVIVTRESIDSAEKNSIRILKPKYNIAHKATV